MPPGIPVATVGINAGVNAALLALHILALTDERWADALRGYRATWQAKVDEQNAALRKERPDAIPY
jgi:5-(carboxyamino)imidazole ribonucleotide mutase